MDKEYIKKLVENKAEEIALKKSITKICEGSITGIVRNKVEATKSEDNEADAISIKRKIIGNTYLWMDSHDDVHDKAVFKKSIKENEKNVFHLVDHEFKLTARIGDPIKIYEGDIAWKDLNVEKEGTTEALFMDSDIKKDYNERIFKDYRSGKIQQHSVAMQYTDLELAVNNEEFEDEHKTWLAYIDKLGNPEKAIEKGYFWLVKGAKLREISAVLLGSNELTPTIEEKTNPEKLSDEAKAIKDWLGIK